jgi:hypothetical protein
MPLTPIGPSPSRGSAPDAFAVQADNLLGVQLPRMVNEINALLPTIDAAVPAAQAAQASASSAQAAANYKGEWSTLTGALAIPASVSHLGAMWALKANTANVALITPGVSSQWQSLASFDLLPSFLFA